MKSKLEIKIERIEQLRSEISVLPPLSPEIEKALWDKFRLEWNYNSNHIEGNTITYYEAQKFLFNKLKVSFHSDREWEELSGHDLAIEMIKELASSTEQPLNESDIRFLHELILVKPYLSDAVTPSGNKTKKMLGVGQYKSQDNYVIKKNGTVFTYINPVDVPAKMHQLLKWYRTPSMHHTLVKASILHYEFILIHPFDDGNGRLARLLLNYELLSNGYPPVIIKSVDKNYFFKCLEIADESKEEDEMNNFEIDKKKRDLIPFYEFIADCLLWSLELVLKAHKGESLEEPDDLEKEISLFKKKIKTKSSLDHLNLTSEEVKKHVFRQVEEFYLQFTNEISQKLSVEFGDIFEYIENVHTSGFSGYKTNVNFAENYLLQSHLSDNFIVDDFNNFQFKLRTTYKFFKPKFKTKLSDFSFVIEFRNSNLNFVVLTRFRTVNQLKEWSLFENVNKKEREELVKEVVKSIFEQIKKSAE